MSNPGNQDPTKESRDNPVTLQGEWVREAAEAGLASDLDAASASPAVEVMAVHRREVENVGPERNPEEEGYRRESVDAEQDSDIGPVEEEEEGEAEANVTADLRLVDAHRFPMAGFRFMFLDLIHAILNRVYYNDHILIRRPCENPVMETPGPSASGHSSMLQILPGPTPSTLRAAEYEAQASGLTRSLPEVISTFPELEEPADYEEIAERYLPAPHLNMQEPAVRAAVVEPAEQAIEEVAPEAIAEEPEKEVIEQIMTSEGVSKEAPEVTEHKELNKAKELDEMGAACPIKFSVEPATKEKEKEESAEEDMGILITDVRGFVSRE
ncbi:putative gene 6268 [Cricetulus griseus]